MIFSYRTFELEHIGTTFCHILLQWGIILVFLPFFLSTSVVVVVVVVVIVLVLVLVVLVLVLGISPLVGLGQGSIVDKLYICSALPANEAHTMLRRYLYEVDCAAATEYPKKHLETCVRSDRTKKERQSTETSNLGLGLSACADMSATKHEGKRGAFCSRTS